MTFGWPVTVWAASRHAAVSAHQGRGNDKAKGPEKNGKGPKKDRDVVMVVERDDWRQHDGAWTDSYRCKQVVLDYYDRRGLPPGLAKRQSLPPGLRKQLRERGHLPPGLEKHWVVVPVGLERELPPLPPHHVRRFVGDDLVVVDLRASLIVSIMPGVFRH